MLNLAAFTRKKETTNWFSLLFIWSWQYFSMFKVLQVLSDWINSVFFFVSNLCNISCDANKWDDQSGTEPEIICESGTKNLEKYVDFVEKSKAWTLESIFLFIFIFLNLTEHSVSVPVNQADIFNMLNDFLLDHESFPEMQLNPCYFLSVQMIQWWEMFLKLIDTEREHQETTQKSFILIPITRCLVTLLCCNFFPRLSGFYYFDICIHASLWWEKVWRRLILIWVRVSFKFSFLLLV